MVKRFGLLLAAVLLLAACTLRIGWPARMEAAPAPTEIPLTGSPVLPVTGSDLAPPPEPILLPPGFTLGVFAEGLDSPRMLEFGPDGHLYVAERGAGRVVRLPDRDGDSRADAVEAVADGLEAPSSLVFSPDGALYVAETTRVWRFSPQDAQGNFRNGEILIDDLPSGGHSTRTLLFSPDGSSLFVSVGSSCNVCVEEDERRAAILRFAPDGSGGEIYARGLRNAVGITFRPGLDELWATDNGRDLMGDDLPPESVYRVQAGGDYGWPRCHAGRIEDPEFGSAGACQDVPAPVVEIQAHSAPLGLVFYSGSQFPSDYQGDLFIALHGSWNRSVPVGYKVVRVPIDGDTTGQVEDFAVGWLEESGSAWGRPVDLTVGPDGSLYVSDDESGGIYQILYEGI